MADDRLSPARIEPQIKAAPGRGGRIRRGLPGEISRQRISKQRKRGRSSNDGAHVSLPMAEAYRVMVSIGLTITPARGRPKLGAISAAALTVPRIDGRFRRRFRGHLMINGW